MTFDRSLEVGEYGTVTTDTAKMKILFTDVPDISKEPGISIVHGVGSVYKFFVFVPVDVYEALVLVHSEEKFLSSLLALCVRLDEGHDGLT